MNGRQAQGLGLMFTALGILVLPGILVNNLQSDGLLRAGSCNNNADCSNIETCSVSTCVLKNTVGCQYDNGTSCQLQGSTIQFLNPCSTWTNLLTLNFIGFVNSFFSNCGNGSAQSTQGGSTAGGNVGIANRTSLTTFNIVCTGSQPTEWNGQQGCQGWLSTWPGATSGGFQVTCQSTAGAAFANGNICLVHPAGTANDECGATGPIPASVFFCAAPNPPLFVGVYMNAGTVGYIINGTTTFVCPNNNAACQFITGTGGGLSANSIITFFFSLLGAAILLLIGLGINIGIGGTILATGASTTLGSNPQGSRFAQTIGLGLLIFFPLYSEFSIWFSQGWLPYGLDGNVFNGQLGIISIVLVVMFFFGLYSLSQSGSSTHA